MADAPQEALHFADEDRTLLEPYLPPKGGDNLLRSDHVFVTLTYAASLDSCISLAPGQQTPLSGPRSKAMTHYLRSRHDAILVGVGTAISDDPSLNCRLAGSDSEVVKQPRPVVLDPRCRWAFTRDSKMLRLAREKRGLAPYIFTTMNHVPAAQQTLLEEHGGEYIVLPSGKSDSRADWTDIFGALSKLKISSTMIEGGANVINSLLRPLNHRLVDSVVLTIAPVWLGRGGLAAQPDRRLDDVGKPMTAARLDRVAWHPLGEDMVLCGKLAI